MTHANNNLVVDSAASATQLATGQLRGAEMVGVNKDGNSAESILEKAKNSLSQNDKGFFLMIEAGQIDWAAHYNDTGTHTSTHTSTHTGTHTGTPVLRYWYLHRGRETPARPLVSCCTTQKSVSAQLKR
jgi:alkaline phosphatase